MIFVLDTNVLGEVVKARPAPLVAAWLRAHRSPSLFTTTVCQAEIFTGLAVMPQGARRSKLVDAAHAMFSRVFEGRILGFDVASALEYAEIIATRRLRGKPIDMTDAMIAAIARAHRATVVTLNVRDFDGCGVEVVNPWDAPAT